MKIPEAVARIRWALFLIMIILFAAPGSGIGTQVQPGDTMQYFPGYDLEGSDMFATDISDWSPVYCAQLCLDEPGCMAATYVEPGTQGPQAWCYIKSAVPLLTPNSFTTSWVMAADRTARNSAVADFSVSPAEIPQGGTVTFTDLSTNAYSWAWDFGDGTTSTLYNPQKTYPRAGTYSVTLTINSDMAQFSTPEGDGLMSTRTRENYVRVTGSEQVYGVLNAASSPAGARLYVDTYYRGITPVAFLSLRPGVHTVEIRMDGYEPASGSVTIEPDRTTRISWDLSPARPVADFTLSSRSGRSPLTVTVYDTSIGSPESWMWTVVHPDGSQETREGQQPGSFLLEGLGTHTITLTVSNARGSTSRTGEVFLYVPNGFIILNSNPSGASIFVDGQFHGTTPLTGLSLKEGTHTLELRLDGYQPASGPVSITGNEGTRITWDLIPLGGGQDPRQPVAVVDGSDASGSAPLAVSFNGLRSSDPDGDIVSYAWDFGDGTQDEGPAVSHTYDNGGTYEVTLTVTDNDGLSATSSPFIVSVNLQVTTIPTVLVTTIPTTTSGNEDVPPFSFPMPLLGGVLPPEILFMLSILTGTAVAALSSATLAEDTSRRLESVEDSAKDVASSAASSQISRTEADTRKLGPVRRGEPILFGLTAPELGVFLLCTGAYAVAFLLRGLLEIDPLNFVILVAAGAVTTLVHQLGHHVASQRVGQAVELRFWSLGAAMLVISSWIFGYLFASPSRNLYGKVPDQSPRSGALVGLAGPLTSVAVAGISLLLVPVGGLVAMAGEILFTLNLMNGVYSLIPLGPMDGKALYDWNRAAWAAVFLPLLVVYFVFCL